MTKRGKILRAPSTGPGPGLVIVEGQQYWFSMEDVVIDGILKSAVPPKPGLAVEVTFDRAGKILAITAVSESPLASKPSQPSHTPSKAPAKAMTHAATKTTAKTSPPTILGKLAAKCGVVNLLKHRRPPAN
jgi:hypothetical protein